MTKTNSEQKSYTLEELQGGKPSTLMVVLANIGLLIIAVGITLPILAIKAYPEVGGWWKFIYAAGAICYFFGKLFTPYTGIHPRIKRLCRIESWSAVFFCVAAFFLFWDGEMMRDVWAFTLAGGVLLIITTIAIPRVINKELKKNNGK